MNAAFIRMGLKKLAAVAQIKLSSQVLGALRYVIAVLLVCGTNLVLLWLTCQRPEMLFILYQ